MNNNCFVVIVLFIFLSCNKNQKNELSNDSLEIRDTITDIKIQNNKVAGCYNYSNDSSSIEMEIKNEGDWLTGKLNYSYFEKDSNKGTFKGKISNDILIADYTFMSEGINSTRQIAFLIRDNQLIEGFGDIVTNSNVVTFKNVENLNFSSNIALDKVMCISEKENLN